MTISTITCVKDKGEWKMQLRIPITKTFTLSRKGEKKKNIGYIFSYQRSKELEIVDRFSIRDKVCFSSLHKYPV